MNSLATLVLLTLAGAIEGSLFHGPNGLDYPQRAPRAIHAQLHHKIAAALAALNSNGAHLDGPGCVLHHQQDPDQGEVVHSAAYPQVAIYHANFQRSPQWTPIVLSAHAPVVGYNSAPVAYGASPANRLRAVQRIPLGYAIPEGASPVDYGHHLHQQLY